MSMKVLLILAAGVLCLWILGKLAGDPPPNYDNEREPLPWIGRN